MPISIRKNGTGQVHVHIPKARISAVADDLARVKELIPWTPENKLWMDAMQFYRAHLDANKQHSVIEQLHNGGDDSER